MALGPWNKTVATTAVETLAPGATHDNCYDLEIVNTGGHGNYAMHNILLDVRYYVEYTYLYRERIAGLCHVTTQPEIHEYQH